MKQQCGPEVGFRQILKRGKLKEREGIELQNIISVTVDF